MALSSAYVIALRRGVLAAGGDVTPWFRSARLRPLFFAAGMIVALLALQSPIDRGGDEFLFSLHMTQHLLLMMVAPPLVLLGICGLVPPARARFHALRRAWWALTRPWPALVIFNVIMLLWHIPSLYDTTLTVEPVHILEHITFMGVGVIFWWPVVDPVRDSRSVTITPLTKIAILVVSGIPTTVLGLSFALAPNPFYDFYVRAPRLWGLSPLGDQQIGGVVMLGASNIIYFFVIAIIFIRMLSDPARDEEEAARRLAGAVR